MLVEGSGKDSTVLGYSKSDYLGISNTKNYSTYGYCGENARLVDQTSNPKSSRTGARASLDQLSLVLSISRKLASYLPVPYEVKVTTISEQRPLADVGCRCSQHRWIHQLEYGDSLVQIC